MADPRFFSVKRQIAFAEIAESGLAEVGFLENPRYILGFGTRHAGARIVNARLGELRD